MHLSIRQSPAAPYQYDFTHNLIFATLCGRDYLGHIPIYPKPPSGYGSGMRKCSHSCAFHCDAAAPR